MLLSLALLGCVLASNGLVNQKVIRKIDLQTNLVQTSVDITLRNDGSSPASTFDFYLPNDQASHTSDIFAEVKGQQVPVSDSQPTDNGRKFTITLQPTLSVGETVQVVVGFIQTHSLVPFPAEITQAENQLVVFSGLLRFYSPYPTDSETTDVILPSAAVESYTESEKLLVKGGTLSYGSFKKTSPFTSEPLRVHYQNNYPFMTFRSVLKEVEVSHWGHLSFEEHIKLYHTGAVLKGGFSRLDYQRNPQASPSHFRQLRAHLPASAQTIYFRDVIGNISTSRAHVNEPPNGVPFTKLELFTRYLLFGGWKTEFYYGYAVPLGEFLGINSAGEYTLRVPFGTAILGAVVDDLTTKIILPEGASNIRVSGVKAEEERSVRKTYLDTSGRPVITLHKTNVVNENQSFVTVTYNFAITSLYFDVLLLVSAFFTIFLFAIIAGRFSLSIGKGATVEPAKESSAPKK